MAGADRLDTCRDRDHQASVSRDLVLGMINCNIPWIGCWVRAEFMRQLKDGHGEFFACNIFAVASLPNQTPLFHFHTEDGGIWWRMPIHAFSSKLGAPPLPLEELVLWDSFSYHCQAIRFDWLWNKRIEYRSRSGVTRAGRYLFTLDWCDPTGTTIAEAPGQHKCGHVIELDCGNYAIQPNNRLLAFDPSFTTRYGKPVIERLLSDRLWSVEDKPKWQFSDDEKYDFDIEGASWLK